MLKLCLFAFSLSSVLIFFSAVAFANFFELMQEVFAVVVILDIYFGRVPRNFCLVAELSPDSLEEGLTRFLNF